MHGTSTAGGPQVCNHISGFDQEGARGDIASDTPEWRGASQPLHVYLQPISGEGVFHPLMLFPTDFLQILT